MGGGAYGPDHSIRTGNPISRAIGYKDKALGPDFTSKYGAGWYGMVGPDMDAMGSSANGVPGAAPMPGVQAMGSFDKSREGMKTNRPGQPIGYAGLSPAGEDASPISAALGSPYSRATPAAVGLMGFPGGYESDPIGAAMSSLGRDGGASGPVGGGRSGRGGRSGPAGGSGGGMGGPMGGGRTGGPPSRGGPSGPSAGAGGGYGGGGRGQPSGPSRSGPSGPGAGSGGGYGGGTSGGQPSGPSRGGFSGPGYSGGGMRGF